MSKSNRSPARDKPAKPHPDFPLFAHGNGMWAKKVLGKLYYFGPWEKPDEALAEWLRVKDARLAGREPPPVGAAGECTVKILCNDFMAKKEAAADAGELSRRSFLDYHRTCLRLIEAFGKDRPVSDLRPEDFSSLREGWMKQWRPTTVGNEIQRARVILNFAYDHRHIEQPLAFASSFERPRRKVVRQHRAKHTAAHGLRMFQAADIRTLLAQASPAIKAMIYLGINCGFGQTDCAELPKSAVDLKAGFIDYPRPKTATRRRCPLWPETVKALRAAIEARPRAKHSADAELVFLTRCGARWVRVGDSPILNDKGEPELDDAGQPRMKVVPDDAVAKGFSKLMKAAGIRVDGERKGLGFYALRHTFRTIADEVRDAPAIDLIMGHTDDSMAGRYRELIDDKRLLTVTGHVRKWLLAKTKGGR